MKTKLMKLMKKFDKPPPTHSTTHTPPPQIKIDYLKRIYYVVNNCGGYARESESARARRAHLHD